MGCYSSMLRIQLLDAPTPEILHRQEVCIPFYQAEYSKLRGSSSLAFENLALTQVYTFFSLRLYSHIKAWAIIDRKLNTFFP